LTDAWYVLNARDAKWYDRGPRGSATRTQRLGACSEQETPDPRVAYARFERPVSGSFREEFLP